MSSSHRQNYSPARAGQRGGFPGRASAILAFLTMLCFGELAQAQIQDAVADRATASTTVSNLRRNVDDLYRRTRNAPCTPQQYRAGVAVPVRGIQTVEVEVCIDSDHSPTEAELANIRNVLIQHGTDPATVRRIAAALIEQRVMPRIQRLESQEAALEILEIEDRAYLAQLGGAYNELVDAIDALNNAVAELRQGLANETTRAQEAETAESNTRAAEDRRLAEEQARTNANVAAIQRGLGRQWLGPQASLLFTSCPGGHNCWTGFTAGFGYAGRPSADLPIGLTGGLHLAGLWGRDGAYDAAGLSAFGTIGYQSMDNRFGVGAGGQYLLMFVLETDGGVAFFGGGPLVTAWWRPVAPVRILVDIGAIFGSIRVADARQPTGRAEDHSAFTFRFGAEFVLPGS